MLLSLFVAGALAGGAAPLDLVYTPTNPPVQLPPTRVYLAPIRDQRILERHFMNPERVRAKTTADGGFLIGAMYNMFGFTYTRFVEPSTLDGELRAALSAELESLGLTVAPAADSDTLTLKVDALQLFTSLSTKFWTLELAFYGELDLTVEDPSGVTLYSDRIAVADVQRAGLMFRRGVRRRAQAPYAELIESAVRDNAALMVHLKTPTAR
ncbi:MAG: hypothetical protein KC912_13555 [Proteobacteria bacterium]|nr:hypothetical protein [Pseudomonadota bacterium]